MFSPQEREKVLKALQGSGIEGSKEELDAIVDNVLQIAEVLHKVWVRHTRKPQNPAPPQSKDIGTARSPPRK